MSATSGATNSAAGPPSDMPLLIGGEWRVAKPTFEVRGTVVRAPRESLAALAALDAAATSKPDIATMPARARRHLATGARVAATHGQRDEFRNSPNATECAVQRAGQGST
jgi:hypothetical protein